MIQVSFTISYNTLGILVSLGFASGTKYTLGIITTLVNIGFRNNNKKRMLASIGFSSSTNNINFELTNRDNNTRVRIGH